MIPLIPLLPNEIALIFKQDATWNQLNPKF